MKFGYKVSLQTETELCQTETSETINGVPTLTIKKKECIEDGKIGTYPYYSGNSWRGIFHRNIAKNIIEDGVNCNLKPVDYHLNYAGGGSNYQIQAFDTVSKLKELNPIISMFGASLAVEGKLMVTNFEPTDKFWRDGKEGFRYSGLRGVVSYTKKDDLLTTGSVDSIKVVSDEDKEEYLEMNADIQEARANARVKKDESADKIKKANIQAFNKAECIIIGANLVGYLGAKDELTDVEYGMMLRGLELMAKEQLGGIRNKGYGVVSYTISKEDNNSSRDVIVSSKNELDIFNPIVETFYNDEERKCIKDFEEWLNSASIENFEVSKLLV